ncbi:hypothetical protein N7474_006437 [Penicillium riverlandense]|uniref:uncharacterized protein n=1 Tax=Penicillium riverlandense TaxID=1903569 RepID=UPI002548117D|nr:uncharacterized protein N7474_006437 [Penicillium riverlandense]KAJ5814660.1 hypothetical protein N7474_006437 [Penicillium riverlandense]
MARRSPIQLHPLALCIFCASVLPIVALTASVPLENYRNGFRTENVREARRVPGHQYETELFKEPFYANANGSLRVFHPRKLAVIGGGIAGVSIAHAFSNEDGAPPEVTIFEREPRLGGRIHTVSLYDENDLFIETGGDTFSPLHRITEQARDVGVEVQDAYLGKNPLSLVSIWDGQNFTLSEKDEARENYMALPNYLALRDYLSLSETDEVRVNFETLSDYQNQPNYLPWNLDGVEDNTDLEVHLKWHMRKGSWPHLGPDKDVLRQFAQSWGFPAEPQEELLASNQRFLRRMVRIADSKLNLNSTVTRIQRHEDLTFDVHWLHEGSTHVESFDAVVIAAPFHQTKIEIDPPLPAAAIPDEVAYKSLHVTHFISRRGLDTATFNLSSHGTVPDKIWHFEPQDPQRALSSSAPPFVSLSRADSYYMHGCMPRSENLYQVVSEQPFSDDDIATLLSQNGIAREDIIFPDQTCYPVKMHSLLAALPLDMRDEFAAKLAEIESASEEPIVGHLGELLGCVEDDPDVRWLHRQPWPNAVPIIDQAYNPGRREMAPRLFYVSGFEGVEGASIAGSVDNAMKVKDRLFYDYMFD